MSLGLDICKAELEKTPDDEFLQKMVEHFHIFEEIFEVNGRKWHQGCGSYLFDGQTYKYTTLMLDKQREFYQACKHAKNCFEIGVYMGHSQLIMLMANPQMEIHGIDIDSTYARLGVDTLKKYFPESKLSLTIAPSLTVMDEILSKKEQWDMFHIDGDHRMDVIKTEWAKCLPYVKPGCAVVFDDIECDFQWFHAVPCKRRVVPNSKWTNMICFF